MHGYFHLLFQFNDKLDNHKLQPGMRIEVVNKMCISGMRVARIQQIIGGRLRLNYVDSQVNTSCTISNFVEAVKQKKSFFVN